jgi:AcrR family transcriptional regulator
MASGTCSKGEITREALMDAAFAVFADKGFLRAQIFDIVREAGKSNGVFHIYFKNMDALLDAWLDRCDDRVPWYWADTDLLFEKAWPFVLKSYWSLYQGFGPIMDALVAAALVSDHFAQRLADLRGKSDASIARMIRHAQGDGRFVGINPELTAVSIAAVLTDTTAYWFRHRAAMEARGIDQDCALAHLLRVSESMLEPCRIGEIAEFGVMRHIG